MEAPETDPTRGEIRTLREAGAAGFSFDARALFENLGAMKATSGR